MKFGGETVLQRILAQWFEVEHMRIAARDEQIAIDGAIALAATDGEHGVSSPRALAMVRWQRHPLDEPMATLK